MFDQDQVKNSLHPLNNPSHFDWISEIVGVPSAKHFD